MRADRSPRGAALVPSFAAVVVTAWVFRPLVDRRLPGTIGDARWTVGIHEHWYGVVRGAEPIRDLLSFHPVDGTLGTSDPLLAQGLIHAAARALGADVLDAWIVAQLATFLFGLLGVAALARRVLLRPATQTALVVLAGASYAVYERFEHVQLHAALWSTWIVAAVIDVGRGRPQWWSLSAIAVLPPVLVLSSWYPFALAVLVAVTFGVLALLVLPTEVVRAHIAAFVRGLGRRANTFSGVVTLFVGAAGWVAALWVYLRGRDIIPPPVWDDVAFFSPRLPDLVNATGRGGGVWSPLYDRVFDAGGDSERAMGFGPILLVALLVAVGVLAWRRWRGAESGLLLATGLTCLVAPLLVVVVVGETSVFRLLWTYVPGFEAVRAPFRIQLLVYPLAILVVLRLLERWWSVRRLGAVVLVVVVGLAVEMHRPPRADWESAQLVPDQLEPLLGEVEATCDVLVVERSPDDGQLLIWVAPIDAVIVSALTGVPTPQGFGRDVPRGHPGFDAYPPALLDWMAEEGVDTPACVLTPEGIVRSRP